MLLRTLLRCGPKSKMNPSQEPMRTIACENVSRILLLRNGESDANLDVDEYCRTPDWKIGLTKKGADQTRAAGKRMIDLLGTEAPVYCYFSPYIRSKESMRCVMQEIYENLNVIGVREDARLRDGDMGRFASPQELRHGLNERVEYGKFFYRFPHGESCADVMDRVSSFLDAFHREQRAFPPNTTVIVVTHGQWIRLFVKRWFNLTVETFDEMTSPPVGTCVQLHQVRGQRGGGIFKLEDASIAALSIADEPHNKFRNTAILGSIKDGAPYM